MAGTGRHSDRDTARRLAAWLLRWVLLVAVWSGSMGALAQQVQPVPALSGRVIDNTGTLDAAQRAKLEAKLAALEAQKGAQVEVLLVPTTQPEDIASYANRVANAWKIGRRDVGDGVLLIVAKDDRKLRIEVAKTLEGAVPDLAAKRAELSARGVNVGGDPHEEHGFLLSLFSGPDDAPVSLSGPVAKA